MDSITCNNIYILNLSISYLFSRWNSAAMNTTEQQCGGFSCSRTPNVTSNLYNEDKYAVRQILIRGSSQGIP